MYLRYIPFLLGKECGKIVAKKHKIIPKKCKIILAF